MLFLSSTYCTIANFIIPFSKYYSVFHLAKNKLTSFYLCSMGFLIPDSGFLILNMKIHLILSHILCINDPNTQPVATRWILCPVVVRVHLYVVECSLCLAGLWPVRSHLASLIISLVSRCCGQADRTR